MRVRLKSVIKNLISLCLCLCIGFSSLSELEAFARISIPDFDSVQPIKSSNHVTVVNHIADPSTVDAYVSIMEGPGRNYNGRYNGRVWTDKSVYAQGTPVTLDGKFSFPFNSDFLEVYSALGSSQQYSGQIPTNLVIVIDNSASMYNGSDWSKSRIAMTISAVNSAIDTLMRQNNQNEVAVVLFGNGNINGEKSENSDTAVTIIPMGRYPVSDSSSMPLQYLKAGWGKEAVAPDIKNLDHTSASGSGYVYVDKSVLEIDGGTGYDYYRNGTTNIHAGMYWGLMELLKAPNKKAKIGDSSVDRTPTIIFLTDGAASDALGGSWYEPQMTSLGFVNDFGTPEDDQFTTPRIVKEYSDPSRPQKKYQLFSEDGVRQVRDNYGESQEYMLLSTLLTASYYKSAVANEYNKECKIYTISMDMPDLSGLTSKLEGKENLNGKYKITTNGPTMNPGSYFNADFINYYSNYNDRSVGYGRYHGMLNAAEFISTWDGTTSLSLNYMPVGSSSGTVDWSGSNMQKNNSLVGPDGNDAKTTRNPWIVYDVQPVVVQAFPTDNKYGVTFEQLRENINYADLAYYATSTTDATTGVQNVFKDIMSKISTAAFRPVNGGANSLNIRNSVTYVDPLGKYMVVKDIDAILLYNKKYDVEVVGVVKPLINDESLSLEERNYYAYDENGDILIWDGKEVVADTLLEAYFNRGYNTDRVGTTYTIYRAVNTEYKNSEINDEPDPDAIVEDPVIVNRVYTDENGKNQVKFNLSEIEIWSENTDDYISDVIDGVDTQYDNSFYATIPSNALPIQLDEIEFGKDENNLVGFTSNKNSDYSMPLRIIYEVGLDDAYTITATVDGVDEVEVDLTKISQEYINTHKDTMGNVWFYANWYAAAEDVAMHGDAATTFAPAEDNRFYMYSVNVDIYNDCVAEVGTGGLVLQSAEEKDEYLKPEYRITGKGRNELDPNGTYYVALEYYEPSGAEKDIGNGEIHWDAAVRKYVIVKLGYNDLRGMSVDFGNESDTSWYITYYDPETDTVYPNNTIFTSLPEDVQKRVRLVTNIGGLRASDFGVLARQKTSNPTNTASYYYYPALGSSTEDNTFSVNNFLGNNGAFSISDSMLRITKQVENSLDGIGIDAPDEEFAMVITVPGRTGQHNTIISAYDKNADIWYERILGVTVTTDNLGFALAPDGSRIIEMAEIRGETVPAYLWLGGFDYAESFNIEAYEQASPVGQSFCVTGWYVTKATVDAAEQAGILTGELIQESIDSDRLVGIEVYRTDESGTGNIYSDVYLCTATYEEQMLEFGDVTLTFNGEEFVYHNSALFYLKDGEGVMINGLPAGTQYQITEFLSDFQVNEGFSYERVYGRSGDTDFIPGIPVEYPNASRTIYQRVTASGTTDAGRTNYARCDQVNFVNTYTPEKLIVYKGLVTGGNTQLENRDLSREFRFTAKFSYDYNSGMGTKKSPLLGTYLYYVAKLTENGGKFLEPAEGARLERVTFAYADVPHPTNRLWRIRTREDGWVEVYEQVTNEIKQRYKLEGAVVIVPDGSAASHWTFKLSGDEYIIIYGLPVSTSYEIFEIEDDYNEHFTGNYHIVTGNVDGVMDRFAASGGEIQSENSDEFVNEKKTPSDITLNLKAKKTVSGNLEYYEGGSDGFEFTLKRYLTNPLPDPVDPTGDGVTVKTDAEGLAVFGDFTFKNAGVYEYTLYENIPSDPLQYMQYDAAVRRVRIVVEEVYDEYGEYKAKLKATVYVDDVLVEMTETSAPGISTFDYFGLFPMQQRRTELFSPSFGYSGSPALCSNFEPFSLNSLIAENQVEIIDDDEVILDEAQPEEDALDGFAPDGGIPAAVPADILPDTEYASHYDVQLAEFVNIYNTGWTSAVIEGRKFLDGASLLDGDFTFKLVPGEIIIGETEPDKIVPSVPEIAPDAPEEGDKDASDEDNPPLEDDGNAAENASEEIAAIISDFVFIPEDLPDIGVDTSGESTPDESESDDTPSEEEPVPEPIVPPDLNFSFGGLFDSMGYLPTAPITSSKYFSCNEPQITKNDGSGWFRFGNIVFTEAGVYNYFIFEQNDGVPGYNYDGSVYRVKITVIDLNKDTPEAGKKLKVLSIELYDGGNNYIGTIGEDGFGFDFLSFRNRVDPADIAIHKVQTKQSDTLPETERTEERLPVDPENIVTYYLTVTNTSSGTAKNVVVTDAVPRPNTGGAQLEYVVGSASGDAVESSEYNEALKTVTWRLGDMMPGESRLLWFQVKVPAVESITEWTNFARARFDNPPDPANPERESNKVVIFEGIPEITIEKSQKTDKYAVPTKNSIVVENLKDGFGNDVGEIVTYFLTIRSVGGSTARDVIVTDRIPDNAKASAVTYNYDAAVEGHAEALVEYNEAARTITWRLGDMQPGEERILTFSIIVPDVASETRWYNHGIATFANNPDNEKSGGTEQIPSNQVEIIEYAPFLTIEKEQAVNDGTPTKEMLKVDQDDVVTYYLVIENTGTETAKNVVVSDVIPDCGEHKGAHKLEFVPDSISCDKEGGYGSYDNVLRKITCYLGNMNPGEKVTVQFKARVPSDSTDYWVNQGELKYDNPPPVSPQNSPLKSNEVRIEETEGLTRLLVTKEVYDKNGMIPAVNPASDRTPADYKYTFAFRLELTLPSGITWEDIKYQVSAYKRLTEYSDADDKNFGIQEELIEKTLVDKELYYDRREADIIASDSVKYQLEPMTSYYDPYGIMPIADVEHSGQKVVITFTLKPGQCLIIYKLPRGTSAKVIELGAEEYRTYVFTDGNSGNLGSDKFSGTMNLSEEQKRHRADFVNTRVEIPATGGHGTRMYIAIGAALIVMSLIIALISCKGERRRNGKPFHIKAKNKKGENRK